MSTFDFPEIQVGFQETYKKVITEGEAALFAGLIGDNTPLAIDLSTVTGQTDQKWHVLHLLMTGVISGILHQKVGKNSQCLNIHFEFLGPLQTGKPILIVIEVLNYEPQKHLATFKVDCYDEKKNQVITGQAVLLVVK